VIWFYVLNFVLAWLGAASFSNQAHDYLDHSLLSDRLVHGLDLGVLGEMFFQPEFGTTHAATASGFHFALLFFFATSLFLPGVLQGYASTYRLPREDFFRACGRNLWRFIRLMIVAGIVMGIVAGLLFWVQGVLLKQAAESTNELLGFEVRVVSLVVIFLVMTALRLWFDLAETDIVLSDQRAVRRSIGVGFRHAWQNLGRLLGSYVVATIVAAIILVAGLWVWLRLVPSASVLGAIFVSQLMLLFLLIPRFWQRGVAVSYYLRNMVEPVVVHPFTPAPVVAPVVVEPTPAPVIPSAPLEPQGL
jgi:predicted PurR-regulated permease PerM